MGLLDRFRKVTPESFAALFIEKLHSLGDTRDWKYDAAKNQLLLPPVAGKPAIEFVNLGNMFGEYAAASSGERAEILRRQTTGMMQKYIPDTLAEARASILPTVRCSHERGQTLLQLGEHASKVDLAVRPLCANLEIGLAYDTEYAMARLSTQHLEDWGITFDAALEIAIDNLRAKSDKPLKQVSPGVFIGEFGDLYDSSRMLLTDLLHRLPVAGNPVVMIPSRGSILITTDRNEAGLAIIVALAESVLQEPRPLSPLMLRHVDGKWESFVPQSVAGKLKLFSVKSDLGDYEAQQALLKRQLERQGLDIFVAKYMASQSNEGIVLSQCAWTEGVHSLLPKTELILLFRPEGKQKFLLPWDKVVEACGNLLKPTQHLPVRYEVTGFPSPELFAQMEKSAEVYWANWRKAHGTNTLSM